MYDNYNNIFVKCLSILKIKRQNNLKFIIFSYVSKRLVTKYKIHSTKIPYFCFKNWSFVCYFVSETVNPIQTETVSSDLYCYLLKLIYVLWLIRYKCIRLNSTCLSSIVTMRINNNLLLFYSYMILVVISYKFISYKYLFILKLSL